MKQLLCSVLFLCLLGTLNAQKDIRGTVKDGTDGETMIGVTVIIKEDNAIGTSTDIDGNFSLLVPENSTLVISYTGYATQEVAVGDQTEFDIIMSEGFNELDEIVVVGYGTQKKSVVTGSISKVKSDKLENMPVLRIENSLQGRTSGVRVVTASGQPGSAATVRIRGTSSFTNADPLYVVDGIPIEGGIDFLSQNDVESIEVIKDANAGIYGSRAANGVILITTKKGKAGHSSVTYHGYMGLQNPWRKLRLLNATEYATIMNEAAAADGQAVIFQDPQSLGEGTDWQDAVFNPNAPIQNHEISLSSGTENSTYYASFSIVDQVGIVASANDSRFKRFTARLNSETKIGDRFTFGNRFSYTHNKSSGVAENSEFGSPLSRALNIDPITPVYETDEAVLSSTQFTTNPVVRDENGVFGISNLVTSEVLNPIAALQTQQNFGQSDKIVANIYGQFKLAEGLTFRSSLGADLAFWGGEGFNPVFYLNSSNRNDINSYSRGQNRGLKWIVENTVSYKKLFGLHDLWVVLGASAEDNSGQVQSGTIKGIAVDNLEDASLVWANDPATQVFNGYEYKERLASYFGRINYNYSQKYLLSLILRADGSSRFLGDNQFGFFPVASAGWVLTEEDFLSNNDKINFLKLRGSWGVNGNKNTIGSSDFASTVGEGRYYTFGTGDDLVNGISSNSIANPGLLWEITKQTNIGFDARLLKRFSLSIDVYNKLTERGLAPGVSPLFVGNNVGSVNIRSMENKGMDLELGYKNNFGAFSFDLIGNVSYSKNKITNLGDATDFLPGETYGPSGEEITRSEVGRPIGFIYGYVVDGVYQNEAELENALPDTRRIGDPSVGDFRFKDVNGDGIIDESDRTMIGDPTPSWTYGFNISGAWKNFDFIVFGQGIAGNDIFNGTRRFDLGMANFNANVLNRWTGEGTTDTYPRMTLSDLNSNIRRSSTFFVESGAFFRLKTAQLGYTLPEHLINRIGMKRMRVYVSGNNLLTFTKYQGLDPEIGAGNGLDRGFYPHARFFLGGVNVTF